MKDFIIVHLLTPLEIGTRFDTWPLHMTLLPWFSAPGMTSIKSALAGVVSPRKTFAAYLSGRDFFGPNRNVPVRLVESTKPLKQLHVSLLSTAEDRGWEVKGRYLGDAYRPHVSENKFVVEFDSFEVNGIDIVQSLPMGYRQLVGRIEFNG